METEGLRTAQVLEYAQLERGFWNSVVQREIRKDLPVAQPGKAGRLFDVDDIVTTQFFAQLLQIGVLVHVAGYVADDLRATLRANPKLKTVYLVTVTDPDGSTRPVIALEQPVNSNLLWSIHVDKGRKQARESIKAAAQAAPEPVRRSSRTAKRRLT